MPAFDYAAYNRSGKLQSGVIAADSERHARRLLKEQKLLPSTLSEVGRQTVDEKTDRWALFGGRREARVDNFDLALLLQQQAILIQSGLPLEDALKMTIEQAETDGQRRMVQSWRSEIVEGRSFSEALRRSPYQIPESIVAGIGVGEESGHLHEVLRRLADDIEGSAENRKTVARALIYPATLMATSLIVISIMMIWVVPKITAIFISSKRELPLMTRIVMGLSDFTQNYGIYLLSFALLAFLAFKQLLRDADRRRRWHQILLKMPGVGRWMHMANIADWSRSLGVLLSNGVPALAALKISSGVVENLYLRAKMEAVTEAMRQGSTLQKALGDNLSGSGFLVHMVGSGEASSELDKMLLRVSEYYSVRLKNAVDVFMKLINPILIVFMGMVILSVVAAVMLPIMDMNNMI
ncbi:MAG: type II secretion system F family protein [Porticoccaceae bacterium]|nr:type II secretion system F family protein [Porticoccaceae bacterium]